MLASAAQFIEEKGVAAVSEATNRTPGNVRVWKHRNQFPREAWPELMERFPELTLDVLKALEERAQ